MDFTEEQKFQLALAYAHAKTSRETEPKDFIRYVYSFLNELDKPEDTTHKIDPDVLT